MKKTMQVFGFLLFCSGIHAQTSDPGVTSTAAASGNHAFTGTYVDSTFPNWLGTGYPATAYNLLGYNSRYWGFGGATGNNIESPIIWMYANPRSALRVRTMNYNGDMTTGTDLLTVRADGNVGIGTTSPNLKLEVSGSDSAIGVGHTTYNWNSSLLIGSEHAVWSSSRTNAPGTYFYRWKGVGSNHDVAYLGQEQGVNGTWGLAFKTDTKTSKTYATSTRMYIQTDGKVGIGTTNPDSKLTVKGGIHAEEVKVDLSVPGPDYVFKEGYELRSLEEVQNYIKENGHLPNIPSAEEMETNGIQLGEMNMKLLEKIEELTLYVIELKKEINQLKSLSK
ncbi:hypothetical protein [Flagellimonas sp. 2504JD1-5]